MFGWKGDSLQRAINARCDNDYCKELKRQSDEEAMACKVKRTVEEDVGSDSCKSLTSRVDHYISIKMIANFSLGLEILPGDVEINDGNM